MNELDIIGQNGAAWYARWLAWSVRGWARQTWDDIPGPWPVKVLVFAVMLAMFITPGPDELIPIIALRIIRHVKAGKNVPRK